tara:strand:- start:340 stop:627 length:288 start_codon:yes stop_codon:yes gene_type:complete
MTVDIGIGDRVRSFDFSTSPGGRDLEGKRACYVEGQVEELVTIEGSLRYRILVKRDIFGGEDSTARVGRYAHPPVNGTPRLIGSSSVTNFVELLS